MSSDEAGHALLRDLGAHNPWWADGVEAFDLPARRKSDFYHLARPDESGSQFEDQRLLALVGRRGTGKTTLLEEFVRHRLRAGDDPAQFCYLPFDANPLYQLQSAEQLRQAVRYYESRVLGRIDDPTPQFLLLDDIHRIEHRNKPDSEGWGQPVAELLDAPERHVVVTASAGAQIHRELRGTSIAEANYDVQPILPEKFRDYVYTLHPELEEGDRRVTPTPLREGERSLPTAVETGDLEGLLEGLRGEYGKIAPVAGRVRSQVVDYLAMGGVLSYAREGVVADASTLAERDYRRLWDDVRDALYQDVPGFETIQTIADLERLCALAARDCAAEPIRYQELVERFDVDRRTITGSYLPALAQLYLLTGVTEYDNSRPRSVRLYLRDTGLVTALADGDPARAFGDYDRELDLARVAAFDHTMRFAYGLSAAQGRREEPTVQYWRGRSGTVDFVFEVDGVPVPIGFAYRPPVEESMDALGEFLDAYDAPVGLLLTGDTVPTDAPIARRDDRIVQLPYWFYLLLC